MKHAILLFKILAAGVLLAVAVIRANAAPVALGLIGFVLLLILSGLLPLTMELRKQKRILQECLDQQKEQEQTEHT